MSGDSDQGSGDRLTNCQRGGKHDSSCYMSVCCHRYSALLASNARQKEALEQIVGLDYNTQRTPLGTLNRAQSIARAALGDS